MKKSIFPVVVVVVVVGAVATLVAARPASATGLVEVLLAGPQEAGRLGGVIAGSGIALPNGITTRPTTVSAGEVVWKVYRDDTDQLGVRHVFYRQYLIPAAQLAASIPARYNTDGIPLSDTAVGIHFDKDGTLAFVYGQQATAPRLTNYPRLNTTSAAAYAAIAAVIESGSYEPFDPSTLRPDVLEAWESSAQLSVLWDATLDGFRFVWQIMLPGAQQETRIPIVDAETGELVTFHEVQAGATPCLTDSTVASWGTAYPQWGNYSNPRSVAATLDDGAATFEAHWPRQVPYNPPIQVFWFDESICGAGPDSWPCNFGRPNAFPFKLVTIPKTGGGTPDFGGWTTVPLEREAADVLYNTRKAMEASYHFGWNGYKGLHDVGLGDPARILLDKFSANRANGGTYYYVETNVRGFCSNVLSDMVAIGKKASGSLPNVSACADIVSHEWGHGISKYSASFPDYPGTGTPGQLIEGFSDVFAHAVEHYAPSTTGVVDWILFRECLAPVDQRPADQWKTWPPYNALAELCYYQGQTVYDPTLRTVGCPKSADGRYPNNHQAGHMLSVALYLLADGNRSGHRNPAYGVPGQPNAPSQVVPNLGTEKASAILFRTMIYYLTRTTTWEAIPALAVRSAFELYRSCPSSNAQAEQDATAAAFAAIGYPYSSRNTCN